MYFLAMSYHHLGRPDEAADSFRVGNDYVEQELPIDQNASSMFWGYRVMLDTLRQEAETLILE